MLTVLFGENGQTNEAAKSDQQLKTMNADASSDTNVGTLEKINPNPKKRIRMIDHWGGS